MKTPLIIGCVLGVLISAFGYLFRIHHWPLGTEMTFIGGSLFLISFVVILAKRRK